MKKKKRTFIHTNLITSDRKIKCENLIIKSVQTVLSYPYLSVEDFILYRKNVKRITNFLNKKGVLKNNIQCFISKEALVQRKKFNVEQYCHNLSTHIFFANPIQFYKYMNIEEFLLLRKNVKTVYKYLKKKGVVK